jgi:hypothetical protein
MKLTKPSLLQFLGFNTQGDLGPWTFYTDKRKNLVFFVKAPPTSPPSIHQTLQRSRFTTIGHYWSHHTDDVKALWEFATQKLKLNLTGFNLFTWYYTVGDRQTLATIERLANVTLIDD